MNSKEKRMTGETISRYRVMEKLGEGGMGAVYRAEDTLLRRTVALKFLNVSSASEAGARARFLREAQAGAVLDHPNICPVYGYEEASGRSFIVMAHVEGTTLARRMREGVALGQALEWMIGIAEGVLYAHGHGIVHRDLKPGNILVANSGIPRITDFGLAKIEDRSRLTAPGALMGTVECMAPEQLMGEDADRRTDVWALGVLFWQMLSGRSPFARGRAQDTMRAILEQPTPALERAGLPPELDAMVKKATAKSRAERYQHVDDLAADLRATRRRLTAEQEAMELRAIGGEDASTVSRTAMGRVFQGGVGRWMTIGGAALFVAIVALLVYSFR
jgi:serine/threonine protein kinase